MTKRKIALAYVVYAIAILGAFAPMMGEAVSKIQVNTDSIQTLSNKTFDSTNTFNGVTLGSAVLSSATLNTPTWGSGVFTMTPLTANGLPYLNASQQLVSTANPTNGQLLLGSTGAAPVLGTLTGTANQVTVTNGAGSVTLSTPQSIGTGSSPTFAGLTLSGLTASKIVTTNGSSVLSTLSSAIGVSDGGLGISTTPSNGFVPIGNGSTYTPAALTAGGGIGITNASGAVTISAIPRVYLAGLTLSTAGSSSTMTTAAGQATDSSGTHVITLASSLGKSTAAWTVGTGNGCLDQSSIANSTWYHFYVILRTDTGVVDVLCSTSASSPLLPTNYTKSRRIGAGLTNGSAQWTLFVQDGDQFLWDAAVLDVNSTNPGTSAVSSTLTVPTGIKVLAIVNQTLTTGAGGASAGLLSSLDQADAAASTSALPLANIYTPASGVAANRLEIRTNTSAQIRRRLSFSDGSVIHRIATIGWLDRRGRDS